jgi:predicted nucleic acid-binding protein
MTVFVDTSAFLAVLNADDEYHAAARKTWEPLITGQEIMLCNNYILIETLALLQNRFGIRAVRVFQDDILPMLEIRWVNEAIHQQAISALLGANQRNLSLVDCTAFETMRQAGITQAFTFDRHYASYGFTMIPES